MKAAILLLLLAATLSGYAALRSASGPVQSSLSAAGDSFNPVLSADGRHLAFVSHANNLVTNDALNPWLDVLVRDFVTSNTLLVSVSASGAGGANADANYPTVSSNGQFIAFVSRASNLIAGDTNEGFDVFLRNVVSGTTHLVSVDVNGNVPDDPDPSSIIPLSGNPMISADGRWVFFESRATNLTATTALSGSVNVYARDMWSNVTVLVSADVTGMPVNDTCEVTSITPDARFAALVTSASNMVLGVEIPGRSIYVRDVPGAQTVWATTNCSGCGNAVLDSTGNIVVYTSRSGTLFRDDRISGEHNFAGIVTNLNYPLHVNANAEVILYNQRVDDTSVVYVRKQSLFRGTNLVGGQLALGLSADGRFGVIQSNGHLYRVALTNDSAYLFDPISVTSGETLSSASHQFSAVSISADGSLVAFDSTAHDVAADDANGARDVFVRDMDARATELITKAASTRPAKTAPAYSFLELNSIGADGRFIVSTRYDDASAGADTNGWRDLFVTDLWSNRVFALSMHSNALFNTNTYEGQVISANGSAIATLRTGRPIAPGLIGNPDYHIAISHRFTQVVTNYVMGQGTFVYLTNDFFTPLIEVAKGDSISLSGNGQLLAFRANDAQLDPDYFDNNGFSDVWLRYPRRREYSPFQLTTNYAILSYGRSGLGNGPSLGPAIAPDGGTVIFATRAGNLLSVSEGGMAQGQYLNYQILAVGLDTNRAETNFIQSYYTPKRLCSYTISFQRYEWLDSGDTNIHHTNYNAVLTPLPVGTSNAVFSANGRYVVFSAGDGSAIWRHDLLATQTNYAFVSSAPYPNYLGSIVATNVVPAASNVLVCTNCRNPSVSADGSVIVFERPRAGSTGVDIFVADLNTGVESTVNVYLSGAVTDDHFPSPVISADGRYVVFQSRAANLIANDDNSATDVFVRDRLLGVTMLVSGNAQGLPGNGPSTRPVIAPDGRTVAFQSFASDLIGGDYNDKRDIFVLTLGSADTDGDGVDDDWEVAYFGSLSRGGSDDYDGDGASERDEFLAGTDPTNNGSVFRVLTVSSVGNGNRQVIWSGNPQRSYRLEYKDNLNSPTWSALNGTISWNGNTASMLDTSVASNPNRFYRAVRLP